MSAFRKQHLDAAAVFLLHRLLPLFRVFYSGYQVSTTFLFLLLLLHSLLHTILLLSVCLSVALFLFCTLLSISSSVFLSVCRCLSLFLFFNLSFCVISRTSELVSFVVVYISTERKEDCGASVEREWKMVQSCPALLPTTNWTLETFLSSMAVIRLHCLLL